MSDKPTDYSALSVDALVAELDKIEFPLKDGIVGENVVGVTQLLLTHAANASNGLPSAMVTDSYGFGNAGTLFSILTLALDKLRKSQSLGRTDKNALSNAKRYLSAICKRVESLNDFNRDIVQKGTAFKAQSAILEAHGEKVDDERLRGLATDGYFQCKKEIEQINTAIAMFEALCKKLNISMRDEPSRG